MLFFKRILAKWVNDAYLADDMEFDVGYPAPSVTGNARGILKKKNISLIHGDQSEGPEFKNPMNITLYNAIGGKIVTFHRWDAQADETYETTYIVDSDEDFEKALAGFIALETIKHV